MPPAKRNGGTITLAVLDQKVESIDARVTAMAETQRDVAVSLQSLVRLEERFAAHSRSVEEDRKVLMDAQRRLEDVEGSLPPLKEARKWFMAGVIGIAALVGLTAYKVIIDKSAQPSLIGTATSTAADTLKRPYEITQPPAEFQSPPQR
jgi:hypothetical protein